MTPHPGSRRDAVAVAAAATGSSRVPDTVDADKLAESFTVEVRERAADVSGYTTFVFAGTETAISRVLARDDSRARAYLICSGTGPLYIGHSADSVYAARTYGIPGSGQLGGVAVLPAGFTLPVTHHESMYAIPDGTHSAMLTVATEQWADE
jgi:hypothetical protein